MANKNRTRTYTEKPRFRRHDGSLRKRRKPTQYPKKRVLVIWKQPKFYLFVIGMIPINYALSAIWFDKSPVSALLHALALVPVNMFIRHYTMKRTG